MIVALCLFGTAREALAGAFNLPAGDGLAIEDVTFSGGDRYFDGLGHMKKADKFKRIDGSVYVEYGITDWLMAIVQPDLRSVSVRGAMESSAFGVGPSEVGAQIKVATLGPAVVAIQANVRLSGLTDRSNPALVGQTSRDAELRGLGGLNFTLGAWPSFLDAQIAYRFRDSGAPDQILADLTLGIRPRERWLVLVQLFGTDTIGTATPFFPRDRYIHIGGSVVYDISTAWSVQLGGFTTILGRRSLREQGLTAALWYRF